MATKILIISDLNWSEESKQISLEDIAEFSEAKGLPIDEKFETINYLFSLVDRFQANIVLLPGDVTGDGSCGHGYHLSFLFLLKILELKKIHSIFIKGNHDVDKYYQCVIQETKDSLFIHELSLKQKVILGINFFGIPFIDSCKRTSLNEFSKKINSIDVLLVHSDLKSRPFLFDYNTSIICSGHFDNKLCFVDDKLFISISNQDSPRNYCFLEYKDKLEFSADYYFEKNAITVNDKELFEATFFRIPSKMRNGEFQYFEAEPGNNKWKELPSWVWEKEIDFIKGNEFKEAVEKLRLIKSLKFSLTIGEIEYLTKLKVNDSHNISKTFISNYLGKNKINGVFAKRQSD